MLKVDSMNSRAILFTAPHTVALGEVEIPEPGPGQVLVQTAFSAISPGTERRCLAGLQAGSPPFPVVPGYALSGQVLKVGAGVEVKQDTLVFCTGTRHLVGANRLWGGHVAHALLEAGGLRRIPQGVSPQQATLTKLAAIAYHGLRLCKPQPQERVLVVGLGPIGLLSARLHQAMGCQVLGVDPLPLRQSLLPQAVENLDQAQARWPGGADIVVDATGVPSVLGQALALAKTLPWDDHDRQGARVLVQGSYPESVSWPYDLAFQREATLLFPRDCQPRDEQTVLELMAQGRLQVEDLISGIFAPEEAPLVYAGLGAGWPTALFAW
jgi:3-hydroxyethyl bacteriochlorophyllide a dehydrogenase